MLAALLKLFKKNTSQRREAERAIQQFFLSRATSGILLSF